MIIISGHFWLVVQAKNVNSSGTFITGSPYCQQCPTGTWFLHATRHLFRYPNRFSFENQRGSGNLKMWVYLTFWVNPKYRNPPDIKKKLPVGPCLWEKRPGHRLSWTGRFWTWTTIDILSALSTSELKSCLLCDHRSICQPHELMKIRKFGNSF